MGKNYYFEFDLGPFMSAKGPEVVAVESREGEIVIEDLKEVHK